VKEIKYLEGATFAHVTSNCNPADMARRGKSLMSYLLLCGGMDPLD